MFELLLTGVGGGAILYTGLRIATGTFFAISGFHKLFNKERHQTLAQTLAADGVPLVPIMQWFVPLVEFLGGMSIALGLLAPLAAFGLFWICLIATLVDGLDRIKSWNPINRADYVGDILYLPEVVYLFILLLIVSNGAGPYALDAIGISILFD